MIFNEFVITGAIKVVNWTLIPSSQRDIEEVRARCRKLVVRRAAISAAISTIPLPGVDIASDFSLFTLLIDDINAEFGLTPEQIERLQPQLKLIAYEAMVGVGGAMVGKMVTRDLVTHLFKRAGMSMLTKHVAKIVPIAGQIASAAMGFSIFRTLGNQHIDACAVIAQELLVLRPKPV